MTPKALKALKGSINKWVKIVRGTGIDDGTINCPLCAIYHNDFNDKVKDLRCRGCPVAARVKDYGCRLTPYDDFVSASSNTDEELVAAVKELRFLQSLLPPSKRR